MNRNSMSDFTVHTSVNTAQALSEESNKSYETGSEYKLHCEWGTYGKPEHFYTDGGKDFRSNHLSQIGAQLGFVCHLRDRPSEGGVFACAVLVMLKHLVIELNGSTSRYGNAIAINSRF